MALEPEQGQVLVLARILPRRELRAAELPARAVQQAELLQVAALPQRAAELVVPEAHRAPAQQPRNNDWLDIENGKTGSL